MFLHMFTFEIRLRLRQISTYVYFAIFFFMCFFSIAARDFGPVGNGKVLLNGPYAALVNFTQLTAFGSILLAAIFGTSILRDFKENTLQLVFTRPISKLTYLGGRWAGSMVISAFVFSGLVFGMIAGSLAPWADHDRIAPIHLGWLLPTYVSIVLVNIFFLGSLYFAVAALTRRIMVVYLQGVVLFAIYLIGFIIVVTGRSLDTFWPSVLDPLGLVLLQSTTKYWTVAERNSQLLSWSGAFLYNRLIWTGVGLVALAVTYWLFPMSVEALTARSGKKMRLAQEEDDEPVRPQGRLRIPSVSRDFGLGAAWMQFVSLTRLRFLNIVREVPFWAIVILMVVLVGINARQAGRFNNTAVWPVTYLIVRVIGGSSGLFLLIVATLYTGEVVWRERDTKFEQIHDSLPLRGWLNSLSQLAAVALVEFLLVAVVMVVGIVAQTLLGYYKFELDVYVKELFFIDYVNILGLVLVAFFCHTFLSNKFVAHAVVIGSFILVPVLQSFGVENRLLLFGEISPYTYSDMNGYGHFVAAVATSTLYWFAFGAVLAAVAVAFERQGTDLAWKSRVAMAGRRWGSVTPVFALSVAVFVGSGAWFFYNAHVLNHFRTLKDNRKLQAEYEKTYKKYQKEPQPKITAVDMDVEIFPERRSFVASGKYTLVNRTAKALDRIHLSNANESIEELSFDRPATAELTDKAHGYWIYRLATPLQPGEAAQLRFKSGYNAAGFRDGGERNDFAYNGTFFDASYFPGIGYNRGAEITDPLRRKEENLPPLEELARPDDPYYSNINLFTPDSEWITFHCNVSTSADQIAVAPGYLKREWTEGGRHHYEYDMGDTRINNFFSFISAKYQVRRETYKGVNLEIYYHQGHEYNLDRMLQSARKGLDYFGANFAPYQFRQFRILEYPRYRTFAQSFPNTVPYSEGLGFIQRVQKEDDLDEIFFITAHELAHQWWGHQLIGGMTQGSNMMSETLAEYSALMIMEKEYGKDQIRKFLTYELDGYLRGRGGERRKEPPLSRVQNEPYVWYQKGSLVMYALRDYMGEEALNGALRKFLQEKRYATGPYPNSIEFVQNLKDAAPAELKSMVSDLFDSIVLFDNKAVTATYSPTADGKYKVVLAVESRKLRADGAGAETEIPFDDWIDIGVFNGKENHEKPLYLEKRRLSGKQQKFEIVVAELPTRAGIDPYHKLIDRKPDDNSISISKQ